MYLQAMGVPDKLHPAMTIAGTAAVFGKTPSSNSHVVANTKNDNNNTVNNDDDDDDNKNDDTVVVMSSCHP